MYCSLDLKKSILWFNKNHNFFFSGKKKEKKITRNGINLNAFNMLVLRLIISFNVICVL